jgi:hypothetical protein
MWPTANAHDGRRPGVDDKSTQGGNLQRDAAQWGTPNSHARPTTAREVDHGIQLANQADEWQTPTANPATYTGGNAAGYLCLPGQVKEFSPPVLPPTGETSPRTSTRRLNPAFACWLMGAPWWWTRAEPISFAALEMESYRQRLRWHLLNLCGESP